MNARKGILIVCVGVLSSCSFLKKPADSPATAKKEDEEVRFLDDITLTPGAKRSEHRYNGRNMNRDVSPGSPALENATAWQFKYAQLLDVPVEEVSNARLYTFIDEWWGAPYRLGGNSKRGIDCSNFVNALMQAVFDLNSTGNSRQLYSQSQKLRRRDELQEGDLVFFKIRRSKNISHVGVYLGNHRFVHASTSSGVMISDLEEPYWQRYYAGAGRIEDGDYGSLRGSGGR
jgi:lipoprotein Spr